jgi:hypothetical protein
MFGVKCPRLDVRRASLPQTSSWTSAHPQGYFSATILVLMTFDDFTLSPCFPSVPNSSDVREGFDAICNTEKKAREAAGSRTGNWQGEILDGYTVSFGQAAGRCTSAVRRI